MLLSLSCKLFKKLPELNAVANCILQIYFKDIMESSKLGKVENIVKWRGAIKVINDELDAWHEELGSLDHPWPEWKTALSPSKTNITNNKWLDIIECQYNYHWLGLPMPCVVPTPIPPTQETKMPRSDKGKWKVTEAEVEKMIVESLHRMEVDDEGGDEVPEKEDNEEEPA
ncbi:hypothetical protein BKA82DRAFT_20116 [Pisolithus tinctorius]|nr:hypothetical protein BKA82DRAFT_20116 [Pisolithus tinctorius]